ncbi:MAG: hypothetical protein J6Y30_11605 [Treponema sp.]|nr:hypothetical protein [Treponema sp.]
MEISFGRNGKENLAENPFARSRMGLNGSKCMFLIIVCKKIVKKALKWKSVSTIFSYEKQLEISFGIWLGAEHQTDFHVVPV